MVQVLTIWWRHLEKETGFQFRYKKNVYLVASNMLAKQYLRAL